MTPTQLSPEALSIIVDNTRKSAQIVLGKMAQRYELNPDDFTMSFDHGAFVYQTERKGDKIHIICGQDMRPTDAREFARLMKEIMQWVIDNKKKDWHFTSVKSSEKDPSEVYDNMTKKHLIPEGRLKYKKMLSLMLLDEQTNQSIMVTSETLSVWDLYKEAHIKLSKKVLGE
jgi:hypothetical protein